MKMTVRSTRYAFRNIVYLFPLAILPAYFLALSVDQTEIRCALEMIFSGEIQEFHFWHLFGAISMLNFVSWYSIVFGIAAVVVGIICCAMMMAMLDKHMRIGKRTFTGVFSKLNDNIISTSWFVLLLLVIYEVWALLTAAVVYISSMIPVDGIAYTLSIVFYLAMHVALIYVIGKIYLWLPCMQITGFKAFEALRYSQYLVAAMRWKLLISQLFVLFFVQAIVMVCSLISLGWLFTLLLTIMYAFVFIVFCVRMMVVYFDRDQIERADLKKY